MAHVLSDYLGFCDTGRNHRPLSDADVSVHAGAAGYLDLGDEGHGAASTSGAVGYCSAYTFRARGGTAMKQEELFGKRLYGLMAEFATPGEIVHAAEAAYAAGYRHMDAYSPMPVHGLDEAIGFRRNLVPLVVLVGALLGAAGGYGLCYYMVALPYVHNIGGRPIHSWPAFIPITFETTVLFASLFAVVGMILMNGLPRPHHPVFNVARFDRASHDRFFLCIEARDRKFNLDETRAFLQGLEPLEVTEVDD
jgi:hypothetical protein